MKPLTYLASPYSDPNPQLREARFRAVSRVAAELSRQGELVFAPIAHSHPLTEHAVRPLPTDWAFWSDIDCDWIRRAHRLLVLTLPGWEDSTGVSAEIEFAKSIGVEVQFLGYMWDRRCILCGDSIVRARELSCIDCNLQGVA